MAYNFDRLDDTSTFNVPYDTRSIMHYDSYAFSQNGQPTLLGKVLIIIIIFIDRSK